MNLYDSKILLVDDNRELAAMIQNILRRSGYIHVDCAESCAEGLRKFCLEEPQLVILDIMLPHLDGFSVCKAANMRGLVSTLAVLVRAPQKT